ncbi:MAG: hypothetical protein Q7R34_15295 [Dehalococcoidia bacterium]|nr:hypothetical protein [Dehalococcoidia bacterium]
MTQLQWATPERLTVLEVLRDNFFNGRCSFGDTDCPTMRKIQQIIIDKIGLPDGDAWEWVFRAAGIVARLSADPPPIPPLEPMPVIVHETYEDGKRVSGSVITGVNPAIVGMGLGRVNKMPTSPKRLLTQDELRHLPTWLFSNLVDYWKADDREARAYLLQLEKRWLHGLPGIYHRGRYDSIHKAEDNAKRPTWTIVEMGVSVFTMARAAKVYIPGMKAYIWVDLTGVKKPSRMSKVKFYRYGKGQAPLSMAEQIEDRCSQAVKRYLETPY